MQNIYWRVFGIKRKMTIMLSGLFVISILLLTGTPVFANSNPVAEQQVVVCTWYGVVYYPGQIITDVAGQQYLCNADGTITYTGLTPTYPSYPNPYPYPYPFDYNVDYTNSVLMSYLYSAYSLPNYQFPYVPNSQFPVSSPSVSSTNDTSTEPQLEYFEQTCVFNGMVYKPGQKFCNSACQEYLCISDGSIVWTGMVRNATCPTCISVAQSE